jgi:acyl-CoA thioester hydrolase
MSLAKDLSALREVSTAVYRTQARSHRRADQKPQDAAMTTQCTIPIRVRYVECDSMGYLHHSHFLPYFEMGRTELLRLCGMRYRDLEDQGIAFVVTKIAVSFKRPARYDDDLELVTKIVRQTHVRIDHTYELYRQESRQLLCTADSTIACVNHQGQVIAIPEKLAVMRASFAKKHT